jgi:GxxExxY protein
MSEDQAARSEQWDPVTINAVTQRIIGAAYRVLNTLGTGFLEKAYENALAVELSRNGLAFIQQCPISVHYEGVLVGEYVADLLVDGRVIVELKATLEHNNLFTAQCLNYLKATGLPVCLLLSFGKSQLDVRRDAHGTFLRMDSSQGLRDP